MRFDTVVDRFTYLAGIGMPLTVWESAQAREETLPPSSGFCKRVVLRIDRESNEVRGVRCGRRERVYERNNFGDWGRGTGRGSNHYSYDKPRSSILRARRSKVEQVGFKPRHTLGEGVKEIPDRFRTLIKSRGRTEVANPARSMATMSAR